MSIRSTCSTAAIVATVVPAPGCAFIPGLQNFGALSAENPLKGQALVWTEKSNEVPFEGQPACTTWPIENSTKMKVTEAEICVDAELYRIVDPMIDGSRAYALHVESDGPGEADYASFSPSFEGKTRKVGSCFVKAANTNNNVWSTIYSACVPNRNAAGQPLVREGRDIQCADGGRKTTRAQRWALC